MSANYLTLVTVNHIIMASIFKPPYLYNEVIFPDKNNMDECMHMLIFHCGDRLIARDFSIISM